MLISMFGHFPSIHEMEEFMITEALKLSGNNQTGAAALLDISRPTLNKRLHRRETEE
jgi:DNA-binding protein Fis